MDLTLATGISVVQNDPVSDSKRNAKQIGETVRRLRTGFGWTQEELGQRADGLNKETINRLELGGNATIDTLVRVAAALELASVEELFADTPDLARHGGTRVLDDPDAPAPFERDITRGYKKNDVPVVGDAEASTNGIIAWTDEGIVKGQIDRWVSRSFADGDPLAYALVVRGDSMSPRYLPGEIVVAQPRIRPRDGEYACVQLASGERLIKRVFRRPGGWTLRSLNPAYLDRDVTDDEIVALHGIRHSIAR